jgi:PIN domain nuclease of toxin-antitoxin system
MIAYLDTNVVKWLVTLEHEQISRRAHKVLNTADLLVSPMVLLEIEYLNEIGRLRIGAAPILEKLQSEIGLKVCDKRFSDVVEKALTAKWTRDPFDRLIVAHAMMNGVAPLITSDEDIRANYPNAVW